MKELFHFISLNKKTFHENISVVMLTKHKNINLIQQHVMLKGAELNWRSVSTQNNFFAFLFEAPSPWKTKQPKQMFSFQQTKISSGLKVFF